MPSSFKENIHTSIHSFLFGSTVIRNYLRAVVLLLILIAAVLLIISTAASLDWPYLNDSPVMIYTGFLVSEGLVPYRDFFDMNMPGNYFLMSLIGSSFGWGDLVFRIFDLILLLIIFISTFIWLKPYGIIPAIAAPVIFSLWYIVSGPGLSLQREYIALVPLAVILSISAGDNNRFIIIKLFITGFLTGVSFLIKPLFPILVIPVLLLFLKNGDAYTKKKIYAFTSGVIIPAGFMFLYLLLSGGLKPFIDIVINYWPLYSHMTGDHEPISGTERIYYIFNKTFTGIVRPFFIMSLIGIISFMLFSADKNKTALFIGLLAASAVYPAFSGQFWYHHWTPFFYFMLCSSSLGSIPVFSLNLNDASDRLAKPKSILLRNIFSVIAFIAFSVLFLGLSYKAYIQWEDPSKISSLEVPVNLGVPDEVFKYLNANMANGDRVQPLDWVGGAVHGMLMAKALPATRFIYDFHFYHHVSNPYINQLRYDFMKDLVHKMPHFIIRVFENKPWPEGKDTTREFPELESFINENYFCAVKGKTYCIYERKI